MAVAVDELSTMRDLKVAASHSLNLGICGGGTHPFQKWSDRKIYPTERFLDVSEKYGFLAKQFTVFGQHIHIGCPTADDAVYLNHALSRYVPHFIALAASSPPPGGCAATSTGCSCSTPSRLSGTKASRYLPLSRS